MPRTTLLPPLTAVRMVWAMTGKFSGDDPSKAIASNVEGEWMNLQQAASTVGTDEKRYVTNASAIMAASLRSLDTVYKGRELNFRENGTLRTTFLQSVKDREKESMNFSGQLKGVLKSLPTTTIGAAIGAAIGISAGLSGALIWVVIGALGILGYLVNVLIVSGAGRQTEMSYVSQDYERGLFFEQYLAQVRVILKSLYMELEQIHKEVFNTHYATEYKRGQAGLQIDIVLAGVHAIHCEYLNKHMSEKKITLDLWTRCDSGRAMNTCPLWKRETKAAR